MKLKDHINYTLDHYEEVTGTETSVQELAQAVKDLIVDEYGTHNMRIFIQELTKC